jgi:sulfur transfer protein SufE
MPSAVECRIEVYLEPNATAVRFSGDVDANVADGVLTVHDYEYREKSGGTGLVLAAAPGSWKSVVVYTIGKNE